MSYGIRRLAAGAISVLALLAFSAPAMAARPSTSGWGEFDSAHFAVHYPPTGSLTDAQTISSNLEAAYATEVRNHVYPAEEHTYTIPPEELEAFQNAVDAGSIEENTLADW